MTDLEKVAERITKRVLKVIGLQILRCTERNLKAQILDELEQIKKETKPIAHEEGEPGSY